MAELNIPAGAQLKSANVDVYLKRNFDEVMWHKSLLMPALRSRGKIKYNKTDVGETCKWRPTYRVPISYAGPGNPTSITFPRKDFWLNAEIPWRFRSSGFSFTEFEKLVNRGSARFFPLMERVLKLGQKAMTEDIRLDLYTDGNSSTDNIMGLQSWTGNTGACGTGMPVAVPNETYATLSCNLGNYTGTWTPGSGKSWPDGQESAGGGYAFWTPMGIDVNNAFFSGDTFKENAQEVMNFGDAYMQALHGEQTELWLFCTDWYRQLRDSLKDLQTIEVTQVSDLTKLGHKTLNYLGVEIGHEYGVPANSGFGLCFEGLELWSLQKQLIMSESDHDIVTSTDLRALKSWFQLVTLVPSYQIYLEEISAAGT